MSDGGNMRERGICRVTLLTPPGPGAIASLAAEGAGCAELIHRCFQPRAGYKGDPFPLGRIRFGTWRNDRGSEEEIVVCRIGDDAFEIHCHGGDAASAAIIESLVAAGAISEPPAAWLVRHVPDPLQQLAWSYLARATTQRTAAILLDQYRGALQRAVEDCIAEFQSATERRADGRECPGLERLAALIPAGLHLVTPWKIVFAGAPNVGKSSLINALLGYERSLVYDQPGTTRDVLTAATALRGWPCELADTAGLRASEDANEAAGIARARQLLTAADLIVLVHDSTAPGSALDPATEGSGPVLHVASKCDLPAAGDWPADAIRTSAVTRAGLETLMEAIVSHLVPCEPQAGDAVPFTATQAECIAGMREAARRGEWHSAIEFGRRLLTTGLPSGVEHPCEFPYTPVLPDDER